MHRRCEVQSIILSKSETSFHSVIRMEISVYKVYKYKEVFEGKKYTILTISEKPNPKHIAESILCVSEQLKKSIPKLEY